MKIWKSKKQTKPGVWISEVRLRNTSPAREAKVNNLLKKLEKDGFDASLS